MLNKKLKTKDENNKPSYKERREQRLNLETMTYFICIFNRYLFFAPEVSICYFQNCMYYYRL